MSNLTEYLKGVKAGGSTFSSTAATELPSGIEKVTFLFLSGAAWMLTFILAPENQLGW